MTTWLGSHLSSAGGPSRAVERAVALGCETFQIFLGAPARYSTKSVSPTEVRAFRKALESAYIEKFFVHASYLINLANPDPELFSRSFSTLKETLSDAEKLGAAGVVLHPGSSGGQEFSKIAPILAKTFRQLLKEVPGSVRLLLENSAGHTNSVGSFAELETLLEKVQNPRLGVCLDTQHAHARFVSLAEETGAATLCTELRQRHLLDHVSLIHLNDSKVAALAQRDRHANLGKGTIGAAGLRRLMLHPELADRCWVIETPDSGTAEEMANVYRVRDGKFQEELRLF